MTAFVHIWLCRDPYAMRNHPLAKAIAPNLKLVDYTALAKRQPVNNKAIDFYTAFEESGITSGVVVVSHRFVLNADKLVEDSPAFITQYLNSCAVFNCNNRDKAQTEHRPPLPELRWPMIFASRFPALILT